ncbi:HORMA domain-containing protein 1 [Haplosporangium bisporale]|nr:HORMA domain-containing protein 1 [Haplosporangium bisporale]
MAQEHTTWNTEPLTRNQSLEAIKEAVLSVVGTVLYVRGIYPEEAYLDCPETGFICKRLVRGKDSHADCLLDSVEHGVFDALTKGYLRQIVVSVLLNLSGTAQRRIGSKIIETYKLTVSYQDGHPSLQLESSPKQSLGLVTDSVEKTRQLGDFDDTAYSNIPVEFMEQQEEQWFPEHLEHVDRNWRSTSSEAKPWAKFRFQRLVVRAAAVMWSEAGIHGNQLAIRFGLVSSSKAYKVLDTLIEEKYLEKGSWAFGKKQAPRILENEENGRRLAELIDPRHLVDFLRAAFDNVLETQGISQTADSSPAFSSNPSRHKVV